jgi:AraC-like DNA-binding protein
MVGHDRVIPDDSGRDIVETRHRTPMARPREDPPRGLLNLDLADGRVHLARYLPSQPIDAFVEQYWTVRWELSGQPPFTPATLPYPSIHLVLEQGEWRLTGVPTARFERTLDGDGAVFGIKFRPGGFRPLIQRSVSDLTDRVVPARQVLSFADDLSEVLQTVDWSDESMVDRVELILRAHLPNPDTRTALATRLVDAIAADRAIVRVEQVVALSGVGHRALQRLFREYVGVSPKWVIQRYRLFEAAERLASGESDGARVAHELGYFDQAHFIRDFKSMVGRSPGTFAAERATAS